MTLVNVRHSYDAQTHLERLVLDLAPAGKTSSVQRPGFFPRGGPKKWSDKTPGCGFGPLWRY